MTFSYAEAYAKRHGLYERSGGLPQHFSALRLLVPANSAKDVDWRDKVLFTRIRYSIMPEYS